LSRIPLSRILPIGLGNASDVANRTAFFGDKVLNHRISQILREKKFHELADPPEHESPAMPAGAEVYHIPDIGFLTLLQGQAMSNQIMAQHVPEILGSHPEMTPELLQRATTLQIHDAGTMIEAAVDAILHWNQDDTPPSDAERAIQEFAEFLVHQAYDATIYFNAKGQLLEQGGTVVAYRLDDGAPDHAPKFRAIATFCNTTYRSDPPSASKKLAEQVAATQVLRQCQLLPKKPVVKRRLVYGGTAASGTSEGAGDVSLEDEGGGGDEQRKARDNSIQIVNYDEDMVEDGVLPDDFYCDIANLATVHSSDMVGDDRPFDAKRFILPKKHKKTQQDFYHIKLTHTVNVNYGESPMESWRRGAYDPKLAYHRTVLAPSMLSDHVETINGWTRMASKDLFTVILILVPKEKLSLEEDKIYPTVKCFVRHDTSRNKARNALGLVVNQYIDQVIMKNFDPPPQPLVQPDRKLWPPLSPKQKEEFLKVKYSRDTFPRPLKERKLWKPEPSSEAREEP
jgi:Double-stranded RNA binding motif